MKPDKLTDESDKLTGFFSFIFYKIVLASFEEYLMHEILENQVFLIIADINLFPELSTNTIKMVEQIMNALLITSKENIQEGINRVLMVENICANSLAKEPSEVLNLLKPMLANFNIFTAQGVDVKLMYPRYHKKKYFWDVGKQAAMNLEFSLEKKLSYDGVTITWESTFIDWIFQLLNLQREHSQYNSQDRLIYYIIEPQATLKHVATLKLIEREVFKYADEYRKALSALHGSKI